MIGKVLELKNTPLATAATKRADQATPATSFDRRPGFGAGALSFLAEVLLFDGHSRCCVDSEIYSMTSKSHWLR